MGSEQGEAELKKLLLASAQGKQMSSVNLRRKSTKVRGHLFVATSLVALLSSTAVAMAQEAAPQIEQVVVSGSRVTRNGYDAPTPTTVLSSSDLDNAGQTTVFSAINQLPSLANSTSSKTYSTGQSFPTAGISTINMRGLGLTRTLQLYDGQRMPAAWITGVTDAGAFPEALVKRVDVVTGGASASWGSDAVSGVANYIIDHDFTGFKGNIAGGMTTYGDDQQATLSLTYGTPFAGGKGHFEVSGEFTDNAGVPKGQGGRTWDYKTKILQQTIPLTPPGQPEYVVAPNVVNFFLAPGGIITAGPLKGIAFGAGGTPYNYQYGALQAGQFMSGGEQTSDMGYNANLDAALTRGTIYTRLSYNIGSATNIYATFNYGTVRTVAHSFPGEYKPGTLTIKCDNAYLPASVSAACATNNITSFQFGTFIADQPDSVANNSRTMTRYVVGGDGAFDFLGTEWTWDAYAEHGGTYDDNKILNAGLVPRFNAAIDAVKAPNGAIVCRSTLSNPTNGCVPLNVIGTGVASQAGLNYYLGTAYDLTWLRQEAASFSLNGEPLNIWAGPVSLALGAEYREEAFKQVADAASNGNAGDPILSSSGNNWFTGNFHPSHGNYHVFEAFVETVIPLLKDDRWGTSDLNLAARAEDYSTAGYVTTWKVGLTYSPGFVEGVKFRVLQSRDIRAPNLSELFAAPSAFTGSVTDPFNGGAQVSAQTPTLGNTLLKPEKAQTTEIGVVYQPSWLPGFSASLDYWRIGVKGAIGSVTAQQEVDLCFAGNQAACGAITRNGAGQIIQVNQVPINLASQVADGFDIETSYTSDLAEFDPRLNGTLVLRALGTNNSKNVTNSGVAGLPLTENAGVNAFGGSGVPHWRWLMTETYQNELYRFTLTERYVSPGKISNLYIQCAPGTCPLPTAFNPTINNNSVKGALYVDLGGSYNLRFDDISSELYFQIDNVADTDPVNVPVGGGITEISKAVNPGLYDVLGRTYRMGIRFSM